MYSNIEILLEDEVEGDVLYSIDFIMTSPPVPGHLSGLPENCYPAEGAEFQFHQIRRKQQGKWYSIVAGEYDAVCEAAYDRYDDLLEAVLHD